MNFWNTVWMEFPFIFDHSLITPIKSTCFRAIHFLLVTRQIQYVCKLKCCKIIRRFVCCEPEERIAQNGSGNNQVSCYRSWSSVQSQYQLGATVYVFTRVFRRHRTLLVSVCRALKITADRDFKISADLTQPIIRVWYRVVCTQTVSEYSAIVRKWLTVHDK